MNGIDPKLLADYVATANDPAYKGDYAVINSKFPELKGYDEQLLKDYVATANNPKYNGDYNVINSKFPELLTETPQQVVQKKNQETPSPTIPPAGQVAATTEIDKPDFTTDWNNFTSQITSALPEIEEKKSLIFKPKEAAAVEAYKNVPEEKKAELDAATIKNQEDTKPIIETETDIVVDETPKAKGKATELIDAINKEDIMAVTGQANPYFLGTTKAAEYENKVAASEESKKQIDNWITQTQNPVTLEKYTPNDYFEWQVQYQKEIDENLPYCMDNYNDYLAKMKSEHPDWSREELSKAGETYWNMFTAKEFENIENNAWNKFAESQKTSMKDASIPQKVDYLLSSMTSNTVIGNFSAYSKAIIDASIDAVQGGEGNVGEFYRSNMDFVKENRSKYKDLSTVQEVAETAILLSADMPVFNLLGAASGAISNYGWRAASEVATIMGVPTNIAKVAAIQSAINIVKSGTQTGILLGAYDSLLAAGDKLSTTKISDLDSEDYQDMFLNPFTKGAVAGMAVGVFSGITHGLLQKMNSNAIKKLYPMVDGKVSTATTGGTAGLKLLNTGVHVGAGIIEGGLIFPLAHAAVDYAKGEEDAFKNITTQSIVEDGLKFLVAIKGQQIGGIIEQIKSSTYMVDPNFKKPFENKFNYSKMELNRWGVKDVAELKEKAKDSDWIKEAQKSGNVTAVDFLKVMYDSEGLMFNNRMAINKTTASTVGKTPVLISYDKDGKTIDIAEYKSNAEAKKAEYIMNEVNVVDNIITNSANLDSRATIELNAEYEKNPEKLVALNEAMLKSPSQRTASESQLILEVADKIDKQVKRIEAEKVEVAPETTKEAEVKTEPKEAVDSTIKNKNALSIDGENVFYHASDIKRNGRLKTSTAQGFGIGVYFASSKELAMENHGENVTEVYINAKKPVETNTKEWNDVINLAIEKENKNKKRDGDGDIIGEVTDYYELTAKNISDAAKELGYDVIIDKGSDTYKNEIIVLDEKIIDYKDDIATKPTKTTDTQSDKTQLMAAKKDKAPELQGEKVLFNRKEVDTIREKAGLNAIKQTAKDMKDFGKKVTNVLKDAKNMGSLSDIKYRSLIKRMTETIKDTKKRDGTIVSREEKQNAVLDYVADALIDAQDRQFKSETYKQQRKAKDFVRAKVNPFGKYTSDVKDALGLDTTNLTKEQLVEYRTALNKFVEAGGKLGQNEATIKEFLDAVSNIEVTPKERKAVEQGDVDTLIKEVFESQITNIKDYKAAQSKLRKIASLAKKVYEKDIAAIPADATPAEREKLEEKAEKKKAETLEYLSSEKGEADLLSKIQEGKKVIKQEYQSKIDENIAEFGSKVQKKEFKDTYTPEAVGIHEEFVFEINSKEVRENMTLKDAELFNYALENINNGFTNDYTNQAIDRAMDIYIETKLLPAFLKIIETKKYKDVKSDIKELESILATTEWYRIDQYFKKTNNAVYEALFYKLNKGTATKEKFVTNMLKDHSKLVDKFMRYQKIKGAAKGKKWNKAAQDADIKTAIILNETMWQTNGVVDANGKVYELGDVRPKDMTSYWGNLESRDIKPGDVTNGLNYERTLKVWNDLKKDAKNFNADGSLSIEYITSKLSPIEKRYLESTKKVNEAMKPYVEWAMEINGRPKKTIENYDMHHIVTDTKRVNREINQDTIDGLLAAAAKPTKQASSTHERTMKAEVIRTDLSNVLKAQVEEVGQNIFERGVLLSTLRALNTVNAKTKDSGNIIGQLQKSIITRQLLSQNKISTGAEKTLRGLISKTTKLAISRFSKIPVELGVNTIRAVWTEGFGVLKHVDPVYKDLLDSVIPDKMSYSSIKQDIQKGTTIGGELMDYTIVTADKAVSPMVFKSAFDKSFEKSTGEKFDVKEYNDSFNYRLKNSEAITKASADGIVRVQELFNAKTALDAAPKVKLFGKDWDKASVEGSLATMLQSYNMNEQSQMFKAALNISEGRKTKDYQLVWKGLRDMSAIPVTNFMYTQLTILTYSMLRRIWKDEDLSGVDDVIKEHYDKYLDLDSIFTSAASSMIGLVAGKYGNFMPILGGMLLATAKDDSRIDKEIKEVVLTSAKDAFIRPVDLSTTSYGNIGTTIGSLHPTFKEAVNIWDTYVNFTALMGIGKEVDEEDKSWLRFGVDLSRYLFPNPLSNQLKGMIRPSGKKEEEKTNDSVSGNNKSINTKKSISSDKSISGGKTISVN